MRFSSQSPLISERIERKRKKKFAFLLRLVRFFAICFAIAFVVGCGVYALCFSRAFIVDYVDVQTDEGIDARDIRSIVFAQMDERQYRFFSQKNIFFLDTTALTDRITHSFALDGLRIRKKFPSTLSVEIHGRPYRVRWLTKGVIYDVDSQGRMNKQSDTQLNTASANTATSTQTSKGIPALELSAQAAKGAPLIRDEGDEGGSLGERVLSDQAVEFALHIAEALKSEGIKVAFLEMRKNGSDIRVVTGEGWDVLLSTRDELAVQIRNVHDVLQGKIKGDRKKLRTIDARFGNRIFYTVQGV